MAFKSICHSLIMMWVIFVTLLKLSNAAAAEPSVPAIYVFGDSTADVGTNNYLPECLAKANMPHHGIDYPGSKPTGRFSNGYNSVDYIAQFLGFKESPPPYLFLVKNQQRGFMRNILRGANFASGGAGILDITGKRPYKRVVPLSEQIKQFTIVRAALVKVIGESKTQERLSNSLFLISIGSNDIFEHFLFDKIPPRGDTYIRNLVAAYEKQLQALIRLGAKKITMVGISPIGCVPALRVQSKTLSCLEVMNGYAKQFNTGVEEILRKFTADGVKPFRYSLARSFDLTYKVINDPSKFGFKDGKAACCGNGNILNAEAPCSPTSKVCSDRGSHLFWDQFHPTETVYKLVAYALFNGDSQHITPRNISRLISIKL